MLALLSPSPKEWVEIACDRLPVLLADHAHCELKAAQSALSLVARFGAEAPEIIAPLSALAQEETQHFEQVHQALAARGEGMQLPSSDAYVGALRQAARSDHQEAPALLDRLLVSALVEARSCERFQLLARHRALGEELCAWYEALMFSEARHYTLFRGLAEDRFGRERCRQRLATLAAREAAIVDALPLGPTVHG